MIMKRLLNIVIISLLASGAIFLFVFANFKQHEVVCSKFDIKITYNGAQELMTKSVIRDLVTRAGIKVKGQRISSIPIKRLQKVISSYPYVKKATVSVSVNGEVIATILQRDPLLRVIDKELNQCLIDHEGYLMPINIEFPVRLVVANGNIPDIKSVQQYAENERKKQKRHHQLKDHTNILPPVLSNIHRIALELQQDTLTTAMVEQIFVNENKEIELIPKLGDQTIVLGDTLLLDEKLNNLRLFYESSMRTFAWNNYKVINLKYKNQVVCSK